MRFVAALLTAMLLLTPACGDGTSSPRAADTPAPAPIPLAATTVRVGEHVIDVEVASSPEERSRGLSFRDELPEGAGMLFDMGVSRVHRFWMRGMQFPLDMVWIDEEKRVVAVTRDVPEPEPGTPDAELPRYSPPEPVRYVLELNAGAAERFAVERGDRIEFELP